MAGTTTNFAIPYPTSTDYVTDGASAMRSLADQVDAVMFTGASSGNLLINGAMQVTQRSAVGTAVTGITTSNYYTADRFITGLTTMGTFTQTTIADAPTGSGFRNSLKMECTTIDASPAAGDFLFMSQRIESQNLQAVRKGTASAQTMTLSFWVKAFQTGTFIVEIYDTPNTRSISKAYTITTSATWQYVSIAIPADTTGTLPNTTTEGLAVNFWLGAGSTWSSGTLATTWGTATNANRAVGVTNLASSTNNYWQVTGTQLTVGSVATPFEFKSFADDLRDCMRYYFRQTSVGANGTIARLAPLGFQTSTTTSAIPILPSVPMRSAFTVSSGGTPQATDDISWSSDNPTLAISSSNGLTGALSVTHAANGAQYRPMLIRAAINTTAFLDYSAEL